ncbi:hypothetical protein J3458_002723 [Metarhizium acridum]|uniref:uncharacterized protein n=1 Tax=Metarhizium acridum TaxID=92637 RepID=UPI001C6C9C27|nr:hypothetical protein J3458_002723 [Metarhizium acridum]
MLKRRPVAKGVVDLVNDPKRAFIKPTSVPDSPIYPSAPPNIETSQPIHSASSPTSFTQPRIPSAYCDNRGITQTANMTPSRITKRLVSRGDASYLKEYA